MKELSESLGGLIIVSGAVLIVYFITRYNYLIKRMMAEKGILQPKTESRISKLDIAYVVVGVGTGLLISAALSLLSLSENTMDLLGWGVVLISGAIGLIMASRKNK